VHHIEEVLKEKTQLETQVFHSFNDSVFVERGEV